MQEFYKKAMLALMLLVALDGVLAGVFVYLSYPAHTLLPASRSDTRWRFGTYSDVVTGGSSQVRLHDASRERLRFDFTLTDTAAYPFVSSELDLVDAKGKVAHEDWTRYHTISFVARCAPAGSMIFVVSTFDDKISKPGKFDTYRSPGTYYSCNERGVPVSLDLARLSIPDWWFHNMKLDYASQGYVLDNVAKVVFGTSGATRRNVASYLEISELALHGRDYRYLGALAVLVLASWVAFAIWFFVAHARALTASLGAKMKKDLPLVAYRQLTLEPFKDKEKAALLRVIATHYTEPELDLERVVTESGVNRNKVNDILKTELGMTFTSYLNKLRLTEAARLLAENNNATVAEIAYSVGYGNVSYFNKLFKEEYGCTPKMFRTMAAQPEAPDGGQDGGRGSGQGGAVAASAAPQEQSSA